LETMPPAIGTTVPGQYERIMQPFWSSNQLATGAAGPLTFFNTVLGNATGGVWGSTVVTLADTNMTIPNALPNRYTLEVKAIGVQFALAIAVADMRAIMKGGFLQLKVLTKDQLQIPLECLTSGSGADGFSTTTAAAGNEIVHNGIAD